MGGVIAPAQSGQAVPVLHTIGYEKAALGAFIAALRAAGVTTLIDVREMPYSRRKEFSRSPLAAALIDAGIAYVHLHGLGNPKPGRDAARAGRRDEYIRIFTAHLEGREAQADLARAAEIAAPGGACLMCYERDARNCHRAMVAEALRRRAGLTVVDLKVANRTRSGDSQPSLF